MSALVTAREIVAQEMEKRGRYHQRIAAEYRDGKHDRHWNIKLVLRGMGAAS